MERQVVALVAAHEESERIASTVSALHALADEVVVVDDGSSDATSSAALLAGATVLRASRRRGKGRAIEEALVRLPAAGRVAPRGRRPRRDAPPSSVPSWTRSGTAGPTWRSPGSRSSPAAGSGS